MLFYIKTALITTFSFLLISCDSSEYMAISTGSTIGGVVVDGYINGATVCADTNNNSLCDLNESTTISKSNGSFILSDVMIERDKTLSILAYGGVDSATNKKLVGQLKTTIDMSRVDKTIVISPITDLVTSSFLNIDINSSLELDDIKQSVSRILNISKNDIDKDPFTDSKLFIKSQEIQHAKYMLQKIIEKNLDTNNSTTLTLQQEIKKELLMQELELERSLIVLESNYNTTVPQNEKDFLTKQFDELKKALQEASKDIWLEQANLNLLQSSIDTQQEKAITKLLDSSDSSPIETVKIDTTKIETVKNIFHSSDAILDIQACSQKNSYSKLSNSEKAITGDDANGISLASQYTDLKNILDPTVSIYYPNLDSSLSNDVTVIFKDNYYFQFDKNWVYNENRYIYIQTPKTDKLEASCFRFELNNKITNKTEGTKVYRQSKI